MAHTIAKDILIRNFSRYAHLYDSYADIQRTAAEKLMRMLPKSGISSILEIGCGTGIYTAFLREKFPMARIKAVDISDEMIEIARRKLPEGRIEFVVNDAEAAVSTGAFDLITSNATLQWFEDLEGALRSYAAALAAGGIVAFSIFGPLTFRELNQSLKEVLGRPGPSYDFPGREELVRVVSAHLRRFSMNEVIVKEKHASLAELLLKIKYTGVRGTGLNGELFWKRDLLKRIEDVYKTKYGAIEASYQLFFCKAVR